MNKLFILIPAAALLLAGCEQSARALDIPFAPTADKALQDPDNPRKTFRVDFARVEHDFPLSREDLMKITPENVKELSQEQVDQIYARLTAGPIPDGGYRGDLFFRKGDTLRSRVGEIAGGLKGEVVDVKIELLEKVGRTLWKGKQFDRDQMVLRNYISDAPFLLPLLGGHTRGIESTRIDRTGPLARVFSQNEVWLLFPAKLYCGQSLLDGRREAVVIDYAFNDEIEGYREKPDALVGRKGLRIRDEIRMVRPGFYLGRAYVNRIFLLNFTLYNDEVAEAGTPPFRAGADIDEDCWVGEQIRQAGVQ